MQIPRRLEDWTLSRIKRLLETGAHENETFDFKERFPAPSDMPGKQRLRKTIAAFANSEDGFLVFGVKDDRQLSVEERLVGIPVEAEFQRDFGSYPMGCQPTVEWRPRATPIKIDDASVIHVFEIISTWGKPHAVDDGGALCFPKRINSGDANMSYSEVQNSFRESEFRRTGLALLISELDHMRSTAEQLLEDSRKTTNTEAHPDRPWTWATRYSTTLLDMTLGNTYPFLTADPDLWKLLCTIREKARSSNARSEAFAGVVFFRFSERIGIHDGYVRELINCAREIAAASEQSTKQLKAL